jgi:hypothetical protein
MPQDESQVESGAQTGSDNNAGLSEEQMQQLIERVYTLLLQDLKIEQERTRLLEQKTLRMKGIRSWH